MPKFTDNEVKFLASVKKLFEENGVTTCLEKSAYHALAKELMTAGESSEAAIVAALWDGIERGLDGASEQSARLQKKIARYEKNGRSAEKEYSRRAALMAVVQADLDDIREQLPQVMTLAKAANLGGASR